MDEKRLWNLMRMLMPDSSINYIFIEEIGYAHSCVVQHLTQETKVLPRVTVKSGARESDEARKEIKIQLPRTVT